jgi:cardiolipin synthase
MSRIMLWCVTWLRVVLIPVFVGVGLQAQELGRAGLDASSYRFWALVVLFAMGASDVADGWIARRYGLMSQVGAIVDMAADKMVQVAVAAFLALSVGPVFHSLPLWFLIVLFGRDLVLFVGVVVLRVQYGTLHVEHRAHGRVASSAVFLVLMWVALALPDRGLLPVMIATALLTLSSATAFALEGSAQASRKGQASG